jgi:hypothetical protein
MAREYIIQVNKSKQLNKEKFEIKNNNELLGQAIRDIEQYWERSQQCHKPSAASIAKIATSKDGV